MKKELGEDKLRSRIPAISSFYYQKGRMPSFSEIAETAGFQSKNAVYKLINKLEKLKVLQRDPKGRLIAGSIAAHQTKTRAQDRRCSNGSSKKI